MESQAWIHPQRKQANEWRSRLFSALVLELPAVLIDLVFEYFQVVGFSSLFDTICLEILGSLAASQVTGWT